jgi:putative toxin-antitoxin system antitoxin component (TIGR02293 family)
MAQIAITGFNEAPQTASESGDIHHVATLLGGHRVLKHALNGPLDAHELLLVGLPGEALTFLERSLKVLDAASFEKAIGMSVRTVQRRKADPSQALNTEQSNRTWKFAEILAKASDIFGGQGPAEQWLERKAIGLDGRRPIDLLATQAGTALVETLLGRIEYGVYT